MISNGKKALIHIAKDQVGMTDQEYLDLLGSVGVESSVDLTNKTFNQVMANFKKLGFESKSGKRSGRGRFPKNKEKLLSKLEAIILDMNLSWSYVDGIAKKRFKVERARWLQPPELYKLVQMMAVHQKRKRRA